MSTDVSITPTTMESPMATVDSGGDLAFMTNKAAFDHLWRVATSYARSMLVPDQFRGKTDDCFIICQLAIRLQVDPFMLMQGMYVVHGRPGMEAKLQIALANKRGPFRGPIQFRMSGSGKNRSCTAYATNKVTGEQVEMEVNMAMAEAEGWTKPKGTMASKWTTMPELMLRYRAASFLIRLFCPDVIMGIPTVEEVEDIAPHYIDAQSSGSSKTEMLLNTEAEHQAVELPKPQQPDKPVPPAEPPRVIPTEPEVPANPDEDADVAMWIDELQSITVIGKVNGAISTIPAKASPEAQKRMRAAAKARIEALLATRGDGANQE